MSNTDGQGSDYTDPHTNSFATEGAATPVAKKPNKFFKVLIMGVGIVFLAVAGFVGWGIFMKPSAPAPAPVQQDPAPALESNADPVAPDAAPEDTAAIDPAAVPLDPAFDPLTPVDPNAIDPATGLPVDGAIVQPTLDPTAPVIAPADATVPAVIDPLAPTPAPVDQPALVQPTDIPLAPASEAIAPPAPVVAPAPAVSVVNDPASSGLSDVMNTARQEMMGALTRIESRLQEMETSFNNRYSALDARVASLEGNRSAAVPAAPRASNAAATAPKPAVRKPRPVARPAAPRPAAPQNRLEIIDSASIAPVSRAVIVDGRVQSANSIQVIESPAQVAEVREVAKPSASSCTIRSIQPGRVWVRRSNGSFATYGVGDALPDGRTVDRVDPNEGVVAGGRPWNCN